MYIVILITVSNKEESERIAHELIKNKLVACVNMLEGVTSLFWWEGKIDKAKEVLLVAKSKKEKLAKIIRCVKSLHSYEVPEIIALPIIGGNRAYLKWIDISLAATSK
ncbi:MAG: divalent-cation tolerance protein CutA [Candidatus Omnitrophota bacterium]